MKFMRFLFYGIACILLTACGSGEQEKIMKVLEHWQGKKMILPDSIMLAKYGTDSAYYTKPSSNYKILVYVDSIGCMSCKLHLAEWGKFIGYTDSVSNNSVDFLFFFHSNNYREMNYQLRMHKFTHPVYFDKNDELNKVNGLPKEDIFHAFLLDKNNDVVVVGNPVNNPAVKELYLREITGKTQDTLQIPLTYISIERQEINVGTFNINNPKQAAFVLQNTGNNPLYISNITTSCGCTSVKYNEQAVNKRTEIFIEIKPEHVGIFHEHIMVYCNTSQSPIKLDIVGEATK